MYLPDIQIDHWLPGRKCKVQKRDWSRRVVVGQIIHGLAETSTTMLARNVHLTVFVGYLGITPMANCPVRVVLVCPSPPMAATPFVVGWLDLGVSRFVPFGIMARRWESASDMAAT